MGLKDKIGKLAKGFAIEPADLADTAFLEGEKLYVREMNAPDSDDYEASRFDVTFDAKGNSQSRLNAANIRARLLVRTLCDEKGERIYADDEADALGASLPRNTADRLFTQAMRINKLARIDEGAEKNAATTAGASPTGSPSPSVPGT